MIQTLIKKSSHAAALCETQHPTLCVKHFEEVKASGDLLEVYDFPTDAPCDMCKAEGKA